MGVVPGLLVRAGTVPVVGAAFDVDLPLWAQIFPGGQVLTVASAHTSDAGSYSCVAVNAVGEDRREIVLQVHSEFLAWRYGGIIGQPFREAGIEGMSPVMCPLRAGEQMEEMGVTT